ncbi:MAG: hypothetical protein GY835_26000 [bacterium]|nr:hypothetical protein [bacterium]
MKKLFLILALVAICATPALADRSMAGGTCVLNSPTTVTPGSTVTFEFDIFNGSADAEWTADVVFTFPACCEVVSGYYDDSMHAGGLCAFTFEGAGTNVASFLDGDEGYGEIYGNDHVYFYVEVTVNCTDGIELIHWFQQGDIYGDEPHFVEGDVEFTVGTTAADISTFSNVKSLY